MSRYCPLCGSELVNDVCPNHGTHFKPMCLNCTHCQADADGETLRCTSEGNMTKAMNRLKESMSDALKDFGYEIKLTPLPLKKPTAKCALWNPDLELIKFTLLPFLKPKEANNNKEEAKTE